jgi:hypothetical protein
MKEKNTTHIGKSFLSSAFTIQRTWGLDTPNPAALDKLDKLAWEEAKVTGTANGDTISVKSVTAAK